MKKIDYELGIDIDEFEDYLLEVASSAVCEAMTRVGGAFNRTNPKLSQWIDDNIEIVVRLENKLEHTKEVDRNVTIN